MKRRINISVSDELVRLIDRLGPNRSRTIEDAVRLYSRTLAKKRIRSSVKEGAIKRADDDLRIAADWFLLEDEAWDRTQK